jgi:hypothetical protein
MDETDAELDGLQSLLDNSLSAAGAHLRSIIRPERSLTARQLVAVTRSMCTLAVSTVTARGEPMVSAADGHFLHGRWIFSTARNAVKARHLAARPAVSLGHLRGEDLGVFTHGTVDVLNPDGGREDPQWPYVLAYLTRYYGQSPMTWGDVICYRVRPRWMAAFASDPQALLASVEAPDKRVSPS